MTDTPLTALRQLVAALYTDPLDEAAYRRALGHAGHVLDQHSALQHGEWTPDTLRALRQSLGMTQIQLAAALLRYELNEDIELTDPKDILRTLYAALTRIRSAIAELEPQ